MKIMVTGAGGFIGRAVTSALCQHPEITAITLLDSRQCTRPDDRRFSVTKLDLTDADRVASTLRDTDAVIHLASVPGGTAEKDPRLSRQINLDATLELLELLDAAGKSTRFVYASSIAVFGEYPTIVDDATLPCPSMVYGAHKRMAEIAIANFHRRGRITSISLRLPGIVARPGRTVGLKSAFMSEVFHAGAALEPFTMPVSPDATMWIMSAACAAWNLVHAALLPTTDGLPLTLPALRVTARELVAAVYSTRPLVEFAPETDVEAQFGAMPPLVTPKAESQGFHHDGNLETLVTEARRAAH